MEIYVYGQYLKLDGKRSNAIFRIDKDRYDNGSYKFLLSLHKLLRIPCPYINIYKNFVTIECEQLVKIDLKPYQDYYVSLKFKQLNGRIQICMVDCLSIDYKKNISEDININGK